MTQRLLEMQTHSDQNEAELARLLALEMPASLGEIPQRRVYANICAQRPRSRRWIPATVLVTMLLVSTTILGAPRLRHWLAEIVYGSPLPPFGVQQVAKAETAQPRQEAMAAPEQAAANPALPPVTVEEGEASAIAPRMGGHRDRPVSPPSGKRRLAGTGSPRALAEESAPAGEVVAAPPPEEAALVMAAVTALRREHNPVRAGTLLDGYLKRFPKGALVEEALAVGIEAAVARQDTVAANALAHRYLGRYPNGRFTGLADKALGVATP